jgi:hypothetical protein
MDDRSGWEERPGAGLGGKAAVVAGLVVLVAVVGGLVWYFTADGESADEVIARYRSRFAEVRAKLRRVGENLPPPGSVAGDTLPAGLDPRPVYDVRTGKTNTACLMAAQCADPDHDPRAPAEFNLRFHGNEFLIHVAWTGDKNPLPGGGRGTPAKDLAERFERSLRLPYLVVARPVRFDPPRAAGDRSFRGGELDLEVFLVGLPGERVLGGFRRQFRPDANVMATLQSDRRDAAVVEEWVYSNVWSKARAEVAATLAAGTGGTFVIDRDAFANVREAAAVP